jgi:hypothetical protein
MTATSCRPAGENAGERVARAEFNDLALVHRLLGPLAMRHIAALFFALLLPSTVFAAPISQKAFEAAVRQQVRSARDWQQPALPGFAKTLRKQLPRALKPVFTARHAETEGGFAAQRKKIGGRMVYVFETVGVGGDKAYLNRYAYDRTGKLLLTRTATGR